MSVESLVYEMSHSVLSNADIKAICKNRGFSDKAATSRSLFESLYLSSTGLQGVMQTLTPLEIATLHLLYMREQTVDISFFERLYSSNKTGGYNYGTFNQQYKPTFDNVQTNLVRKGLLIITEAKSSALNKTKMELWRYRFPPEFGQYLPPLLAQSPRSNEVGEVAEDALRHHFRQLIQKPNSPDVLSLREGTIYIKNQVLSVKAIEEWRKSEWRANLVNIDRASYSPSVIFQGYIPSESNNYSYNPLPFVEYALGQLKPDEWATPGQLETLLAIGYGSKKHPAPKLLYETGYNSGNLVRCYLKDRYCYRLPDARHTLRSDSPETYLKVLADGTVEILIGKIPYPELEILNQTVYLKVDQGKLQALPAINKLTNAPDTVREHLVLNYLKKHSTAFQQIFAKLDKEWGRVLLHSNMLVARITDLGLRLQLQKALANSSNNETRLVYLAGEYVAFPRSMLGEVEKLVKKAGHIIKTVQAK